MKTTFDIQLSEHFKLSEFVQTSYSDFQLLDSKQFQNICTLVSDFLEPLRLKLGVPIKINSGFRGELVNERVGGVKTSLHKLGLASDICSKFVTPDVIYETLNDIIKFSIYPSVAIELIKYPTFVHIGIDIKKLVDYENKNN